MACYRGGWVYRPGDVRHSQADISKPADRLGYAPEYRIVEGLAKAMPWDLKHLRHCFETGEADLRLQ